MYHVEVMEVCPDNPGFAYLDYACLCANNMYNISNFYIRNLMTGLKKASGLRTSNEKDVIRIVSEAIPPVNEALKAKHGQKVKKIMADKSLSVDERKEKAAKVKCAQFSIPTEEKWFAGYNLLDAIFKQTDNPDYRAHHSHLIQNAISDCTEAWTSFFEQPSDGNGLGKKHLPGYRKRGGRSTAVFSNISCSVKHGQLVFPYAQLPVKKEEKNQYEYP